MDFIFQVVSILFWFIVILIPLVAFHELGHLLMSRLVGVKVMEYGIGIPPRWLYVRWKGIIWSLNYILLGGFARIYGDHDAIDEAQETAKTDQAKAKTEYLENRLAELVANQEIKFFLEENNLDYDGSWQGFEKSKFARGTQVSSESEKIAEYEALVKQLETLIEWEFESKLKSKEAFFSKNWFQQTLIISGGVIFNLIAAVALLWIMFTTTGTLAQNSFPESNTSISQYANIAEKSEYLNTPRVIVDGAAYKAGVRGGDDLISLAGRDLSNIQSLEEFKAILSDNEGQEVPIVFRSNETGEFIDQTVKLEKNDDGDVYLGVIDVGYRINYKAKNIGSGFLMAVDQTWNFFTLNFKALGEVVVALLPQTQDRAALEYVSGPLAVGSISSNIFTQYGFSGLLLLMALISISLAAFNTLPLPALDGGRLVIITLNKVFGKRNKKWEAIAISITFFALLALGVLIAFKDVQGIIAGKY
ncbi:MAG: M50 family metallopeptidase [Patescibacteria group bacterium]